MQVRVTNFCTSSARFASSFARQPNGTECTQIVRNAPKHQFRVQWGGSGAFVAKKSDATSWHELLHKFGPFSTECCNATNCPKCTEIVRNTPTHDVRVQSGGSGAFVAKNSDTTSWHELLHHFGPFCTAFCRATKGSQCTRIVRNAPKREFRVQWGGSGAFIAKNSDTTSWHELLHQFGPFCTEFCKSTKRSPMHQNCTKCTRT